MSGFTILEIILVVLIIGILVSFILPIGFNFYNSQQLEVESQTLLQTLRRAQSKAMSVDSDSSFGVSLTPGHFTLFKGDSYSTRDPQYDEVFDLPENVTVSGLSEIVFLRLEGIPKNNLPYCGGTCTPCSQFNRQTCGNQAGCSWDNKQKICTGTCTPCNTFQNQTSCQRQSGCTWYSGGQGVGDIILSSGGNTRTININEIGRVNLKL